MVGDIMVSAQVRGYFFEEIIRQLMMRTGYVNVETGNIEGRGADHQIDSYGTFAFNVPFIYPVRLISEVKWYKNGVGLPHVRNFVGVIKDISENYFAIRSKTDDKYSKERYTDCGAIFSANTFSEESQNYAWAQGIYLIPFENNTFFEPIKRRALDLMKNIYFTQSKKEVIREAKKRIKTDSEMQHLMNKIASYMGILDGIYPIMIISDGDFELTSSTPDECETSEGRLGRAEKEYRLEEENSINFRFRFKERFFEFTIPKTSGKRLIHRIETTKAGEPFSYIDLPIMLSTQKGTYRRIFRIKLHLPEKGRVISEIKRHNMERNLFSAHSEALKEQMDRG